jgi:PST family polysaccharide transporter
MGLIRTKAIAVLIGPTGVGIIGIYLSITELANTIAGMGIQTSGVRDVAKSFSENDNTSISATVHTLRRVCWITGLLGLAILVILSPWISELSFGTREFSLAVSVLGLSILFTSLAGGQSAILRGTRRIGDLARLQVIGAVLGTVVSILLYWWLGLAGIVPSLVLIAFLTLCASNFYARQVPLTPVRVAWSQTWNHALRLFSFGSNLMIASLVATATAYATRVFLSNDFGLEGVGVYAAAYTLSAIFIQFVLQAMGTDFYPRLTAASNDHALMTRLINEQTEIGLLLAFPGLLATLAFAPLAIIVFYTSDFAPAASMLKWFVLGCMGRVVSWPLGYCLLAKGSGVQYAVLDSLISILQLVLIVVLVSYLGLDGAAIAFALVCFFHAAVLFVICRYTLSYGWSPQLIRLFSWMIPLAALCFLVSFSLPQQYAIPAGIGLSLVSGYLCLRNLLVHVRPNFRFLDRRQA